MSVQPITILLVYGMHALCNREEKYFGFVKRFLANENGFSRYVGKHCDGDATLI